jgi:hypothetical protein
LLAERRKNPRAFARAFAKVLKHSRMTALKNDATAENVAVGYAKVNFEIASGAAAFVGDPIIV